MQPLPNNHFYNCISEVKSYQYIMNKYCHVLQSSAVSISVYCTKKKKKPECSNQLEVIVTPAFLSHQHMSSKCTPDLVDYINL